MNIAEDYPNRSDGRGLVFGRRHLQTFLIFCGTMCAYMMRVNLSLAIVAMTDNNVLQSSFQTYDWNEKTKGLVLSSFFWGYCITQIPSGILVHRTGPKGMVLFGMIPSMIATFLTPLGASIGDWPTVCVLRFMSGLGQGVIFPATHQMLANWTPLEERTILGGLAYSGVMLGTTITLATGGVVASSAIGWPGIFYITAGVTVIWLLAWIIWGENSPDTCKLITCKEKDYIAASLDQKERTETKLRVPWKEIFTSPAFLIMPIVHASQAWGFWTLLTEIPTYMKSIMGVNIKQNALLSALPYFGLFIAYLLCAVLAIYLKRQKTISKATSRRFFNSLGYWVPAITLIGLSYMKADQITLAVVLLTATVSMTGFINLGFQYNHMDLSPNFAGLLMGFTNCMANVLSFLAPIAVGFIIHDEKDQNQWRTVFFIASAFYFVGNLLFIIFGRFEVQPWNEPKK